MLCGRLVDSFDLLLHVRYIYSIFVSYVSFLLGVWAAGSEWQDLPCAPTVINASSPFLLRWICWASG